MESQEIKISIHLEYKNGELVIKSLNTNEMPVYLSLGILTAIQTSVESYFKDKED